MIKSTPAAGAIEWNEICRRSLPWLGRGWCALVLSVGCLSAVAADPVAKVPAKQDVMVTTEDGVKIHATYYPSAATGADEKKETVPVICLHGFGGNRHEFDSLAASLQKNNKCAVIVPDLRGHGDSADKDKKLEATTLTPVQFQNMVKYDLEAIKKFLMDKNNSGDLNIDKLCIVGSEMGAGTAMLWTAMDWSWPPLLTGKVGQDVKAVVMISPDVNIKSFNITDASKINGVRDKVSLYVVMGASDTAAVSSAKRVYNLFDRFHKEPAKPTDRDIFFDQKLKTKLQGTKLLSEPSLGLADSIGQFIHYRAATQPFPWAERKVR